MRRCFLLGLDFLTRERCVTFATADFLDRREFDLVLWRRVGSVLDRFRSNLVDFFRLIGVLRSVESLRSVVRSVDAAKLDWFVGALKKKQILFFIM